MTLTWPLTDWHEPDLDRGIIEHKTMDKAEIRRAITSGNINRTTVFRAADVFATAADRAGIAVTSDTWCLGGADPNR